MSDTLRGYIAGEPNPYKQGHTEKHFRCGEANPFFGRLHSLESRIKISLANGGNGDVSPEGIKDNKAKKTAAWQKNNREKILEYDAKYRDRRGRYRHDRYHTLREKVFEKLGARCSSSSCRWLNDDGTLGCTDRRLLQVDHVHGGGSGRTTRKDGHLMMLDVLSGKYEGDFQILCSNCNWIKRHTNKEVPVSRFQNNRRIA